MKANELMIGDYISVKPSGMPIKIAAVHHKKVAYHAVINKLAWVRESLLEPIPLTTDILEKNGFVKKEYRWILPDLYTEDNLIVLLNVANGFALPTAEGITLGFQYIHELQHFYKLCGIKKEIIF